MSLGAKPITATGMNGPMLKPGTYFVSITAELSNPDKVNAVTGSCQVEVLPSGDVTSIGLMGGAFALGPYVPPGYDQTAPSGGNWSGDFSYSGVIRLTQKLQLHFGCGITSEDGVSVGQSASWWIVPQS